MPRREYVSGPDDAVSTEGIEFAIDGVVFVCHGRVSAFDLSEFAGPAADAGDNVLDAGVMRILADMMRAVLGPDTYREVRNHRIKHHTPDGVMQQILTDIVEDAAARPSPGPSPSPAGRTAPAPASPAAVSPSPAGRRGRKAPQDHLPARRRAKQPAPAVGDRAGTVTALAAVGGEVRYAPARAAGAPPAPRPAVTRRITAAGQVIIEPDSQQDQPPEGQAGTG